MSVCPDIDRYDLDGGITMWRTAVITASDRKSRREAEHDATSRLVVAAFGERAELHHEPSGVPFILIPDTDTTLRSVSISHCSDTAMLAVAPEGTAIGIDCEHFRKALRNVAARILSADELAPWTATDERLLRAWTIKEAVYKAALTPGLPFADGIRLPNPDNVADTTDRYATTSDGRRFHLILLPLATIAIATGQK